jgi:hypothetical protein
MLMICDHLCQIQGPTHFVERQSTWLLKSFSRRDTTEQWTGGPLVGHTT